jgi:hypothetical protein
MNFYDLFVSWGLLGSHEILQEIVANRGFATKINVGFADVFMTRLRRVSSGLRPEN